MLITGTITFPKLIDSKTGKVTTVEVENFKLEILTNASALGHEAGKLMRKNFSNKEINV